MNRQQEQEFTQELIDVTKKHLNPNIEDDMRAYKAIHAVVAQYLIGRAGKAWEALKPLDDGLSDEIDSIMN